MLNLENAAVASLWRPAWLICVRIYTKAAHTFQSANHYLETLKIYS